MKNKPIFRYFLLFPMLGMAGALQAQDLASTGFDFSMNDFLMIISLLLAVLLLFLLFVMLSFVQHLKEEGKEKAERLSIWERLLSLKPMSKEKDLMMEHAYDGIYELDNPTPPWFNFLFYGTILFAVVYLVRYHVQGDGMVQENEYQAEMAMWEAKTAAYQATQTDAIDESSVTLVTDPAELGKAAEIFKSRCATCHGDKAEGKNGPNLTDAYWLHGGELKDIFSTITNGVPEKGMVPWKGVLKPAEIQSMASYILSLKGTLPEGVGKGPEGEMTKPAEEAPGETPAADTTQAMSELIH